MVTVLSIMLFMLKRAPLIKSLISFAVRCSWPSVPLPLSARSAISLICSIAVSARMFKSAADSGSSIIASRTDVLVPARLFISAEISTNELVVSFTEVPIIVIAVRVSSAVSRAVLSASTIFLRVFDASAALRAVASDSFLISPATTANPNPAFPACADSIAAFIANRFVCALTSLIEPIMSFTASMF